MVPCVHHRGDEAAMFYQKHQMMETTTSPESSSGENHANRSSTSQTGEIHNWDVPLDINEALWDWENLDWL